MLNTSFLQKNAAALIISISTLILLFIAIHFPGTGEDGDSVQHFMFSRWAYDYPRNFYIPWAKPIYVFLTAPIAQYGFVAVKVFNVLVFAATQYFAYATAQKLGVRNAWLAPLFIFLTPMEIYFTPSGLTEPLWALWFIISVYLAVSQRLVAATIFVSFLPFVRSEGLIILCIFLPYLLFKRRFALLPLLLLGHIVYMLLGAKYYNNDYFWVFTRMSYATLEGAYGAGPWTHFLENMKSVTGSALYFLLVLGTVLGIWRLGKYWFKKEAFSKEELWLVYGCSAAYFIGHTAFWALGIFNSFGLMRVIIGIMPTFAILMVHGYNFLWEWVENKEKRATWAFFILSILYIGWSSSKQFKIADLGLVSDQLATKQALDANPNLVKDATLYFDNTSVALFLDSDYFSNKQHRHCNRLINGEPVPADALIFWDDWYSRSEYNVPLEKLQQDPRFKEVGVYSAGGKSIHVFKRDTSVIKVTNVLFNKDFETPAEKENLDSKFAFSGKYANIAGGKTPYSNGFEGVYNSMINKNGQAKIKISAKILLTKANENPQLVIEVKRNGVISLWKGVNISDQVKQSNVWSDFQTIESFDIDAASDDKVDIYFWNEREAPMYIDDFKIEIVD
jgi:hypothetical protein